MRIAAQESELCHFVRRVAVAEAGSRGETSVVIGAWLQVTRLRLVVVLLMVVLWLPGGSGLPAV
jgi:hypothetical protein